VERDRIKSAALFVAIAATTFAVAGVGGFATAPEILGWNAHLAKPSFYPPNWIFGPVWTLLYAFMAVAAWRVARQGRALLELAAYALQLALNLAWPLIFFGGHLVGAALLEIGLLWLAVAGTLILFWRRDRPAGLLFVPYLAWVSFAALLNAAIWRLNGG
jgi:tryptophan-rich sensory protein